MFSKLEVNLSCLKYVNESLISSQLSVIKILLRIVILLCTLVHRDYVFIIQVRSSNRLKLLITEIKL